MVEFLYPTPETDFHTRTDIEIEKIIFYKAPILVKEYELVNEKKEYDWYMPFKLYLKPNLINDNNLKENFSEEFIKEEMSSGIEKYLQDNSFFTKMFELNTYLYVHSVVEFVFKPNGLKNKVVIFEMSDKEITINDTSFYAIYNSSSEEMIRYVWPFPMVFQNNRYKIIPPSMVKQIFTGYLSIYQFGHSDNFQKLLDAVPSYIESTKNADGTRVEKVVVNED